MQPSHLCEDTLLMEIRHLTINYTAAKKRDRLAKQQLLSHEIEALELQLQTLPTEDIANQLQQKKNDIENIFQEEAQGAFVRAKTKYQTDGERPTRLFCSLEKHNGTQKYIPSLIVTRDDKEVKIDSQKEVEDETVKFYTKLFSNQDDKIKVDKIEDFLEDSNTIPKLTENQQNSM